MANYKERNKQTKNTFRHTEKYIKIQTNRIEKEKKHLENQRNKYRQKDGQAGKKKSVVCHIFFNIRREAAKKVPFF